MADRSSRYRVSSVLKGLELCGQRQVTGQLQILSPTQQWILYCYQGKIIGDRGGIHPIRRWRRQLSQQCPQLQQQLPTDPDLHQWQECHWEQLVQKGLCSPFQAEQVLLGSVQEILFDSLQESACLRREARQDLWCFLIGIELPAQMIPVVELPPALSAEHLGQQTTHYWRLWQRTGLQGLSPNLGLVIRRTLSWRGYRSAPVLRRLAQMIDGHRTLRDLALKLGQDVLMLTQSILPLIRQGSLQLVAVADLGVTSPVTEVTIFAPPTPEAQSAPAVSPLIAYIDDQQINGQIVRQILKPLGYPYLMIHDPLQMIAALVEHHPDLILLDLVMPITSGYEMCTQIRQLASFEGVPIALVAANPNYVDRARARGVGATDIVIKPITADKVTCLLQKHGLIPSSVSP